MADILSNLLLASKQNNSCEQSEKGKLELYGNKSGTVAEVESPGLETSALMGINLVLSDEDDSDPSDKDQSKPDGKPGDFDLEIDNVELDKEEITVDFWEENDDGDKVVNTEKQYLMSPVELFVGVKINLNNKLYNEKANKAYQQRAKKMMKYVTHG